MHLEIRKGNIAHFGEENTIDTLTLLPNIDFNQLDKNFDEDPYADLWLKMVDNPWSFSDRDISYANDTALIR